MSNNNRFSVLNRYYRITKFYSFLRGTLIRGGLIVGVGVALIVLLEVFLLDFDLIFDSIIAKNSSERILGIFFLSETLFGLLPPEIFIGWSAKTATPIGNLFLLALLSYTGGVISYWLGRLLVSFASVKRWVEKRIADHIVHIRKWGGIFIVMGAMLPFPHAMVSMASGVINYRFRNYLLWALFRFVRFALYALVIFKVL